MIDLCVNTRYFTDRHTGLSTDHFKEHSWNLDQWPLICVLLCGCRFCSWYTVTKRKTMEFHQHAKPVVSLLSVVRNSNSGSGLLSAIKATVSNVPTTRNTWPSFQGKHLCSYLQISDHCWGWSTINYWNDPWTNMAAWGRRQIQSKFNK